MMPTGGDLIFFLSWPPPPPCCQGGQQIFTSQHTQDCGMLCCLFQSLIWQLSKVSRGACTSRYATCVLFGQQACKHVLGPGGCGARGVEQLLNLGLLVVPIGVKAQSYIFLLRCQPAQQILASLGEVCFWASLPLQRTNDVTASCADVV